MPRYLHFEELPVWQEASRLYHHVLDLLEQPALGVSSGFRNQLDRAALSVSNNIAEGFERNTTNELLSFLAIARGSSAEVRSMVKVVRTRPKLHAHRSAMDIIEQSAASCVRQLTAWMQAQEQSGITGKRHLTGREREDREIARKAADFKLRFLRSIEPTHPLYNTPDAQAARDQPIT